MESSGRICSGGPAGRLRFVNNRNQRHVFSAKSFPHRRCAAAIRLVAGGELAVAPLSTETRCWCPRQGATKREATISFIACSA